MLRSALSILTDMDVNVTYSAKRRRKKEAELFVVFRPFVHILSKVKLIRRTLLFMDRIWDLAGHRAWSNGLTSKLYCFC